MSTAIYLYYKKWQEGGENGWIHGIHGSCYALITLEYIDGEFAECVDCPEETAISAGDLRYSTDMISFARFVMDHTYNFQKKGNKFRQYPTY